MKQFLLITLLLSTLVFAQEWGLDRPYTLRNLDYQPLLKNLHQQVQGGEMSGLFPRRDSLWRSVPEKPGIWQWKTPTEYLNLNLGIGYEFRALDAKSDTVQAMDGGLRLQGYKDSLEFWLDARIYNESHSKSHINQYDSWDREFLENHDSANGGISSTSYARYRGNMALHLGWARITAGRDVAHWGPGFYGNLTFNQNAIPFPQLGMESQIGPLIVKSLYGDLNVDAISMSPKNTRIHDIYAHRYELQISSNFWIAINEQTMLDSASEPILFVPLVPLFMHKGQISENNNNGTISMDMAYRIPQWVRVYGELLLDDLASPVSLIKNQDAESKWAGLAGIHIAHNWKSWELGGLFEATRVEPWVYTHFVAHTAQVTHQGIPLGNPLGPNSLSLDWLLYGRHKGCLFASSRLRWWWKGTDLGSNLQDETPNQHFQTPKQFLQGAEGQFSWMPSIAWTGRYVGIQLEASFFDNPSLYSRVAVQW